MRMRTHGRKLINTSLIRSVLEEESQTSNEQNQHCENESQFLILANQIERAIQCLLR